MASTTVVGFDFGTTNSLVSRIDRGRAINYLDDDLPIPSAVCYEGSEKLFGREAKERFAEAGLGVKGSAIRSPKILLGQESVFIEGVEKHPVDIVSDVVNFIKEMTLKGDEHEIDTIERAVVTIPVGMQGFKRAALRDAFRSAGISIVQFVHEPLAALYGFFRTQPNLDQALRAFDRKLFLVFDWGGGTLDLTLCRLQDGMLLQVRNDGTDDVGGDMFDELLRNEVIKRVMDERQLDHAVEIHPDSSMRLLHKCERAKIDLSTRDRNELFVANFFHGTEDDDIEFTLTREVLEKIVAPLLDKGLSRIQRLLNSADVSRAQLAACIATGGMANMPAIKSRLHEWFGPQRVHVSDGSGTLIAEGAAWIAHDQAQLSLAKSVELLLARNSRMTLVPSGTIMPIEGEVKRDCFHLYCSDPRDGHAKFQIDSPIRTGNGLLSNDTRISLATLVTPVDSKAKPFHERLELDIEIDDNLILQACARSLNIQGLSQAEVHDLEFGLQFPIVESHGAEESDDDPIPAKQELHEEGSLVMRSNIAKSKDDNLVPGELLYQYNPGHFDVRRLPPKYQDEERLYYAPCTICGRASNDPLCHCDGDLSL